MSITRAVLLSILLVLLGGALVTRSTAAAATYHVAKTGNNSVSCSNADFTPDNTQAKLTIAAGTSCLSAGDTLIIHVGTYTERMNNTIPSGVSSFTTATVVKAQPGETVTLAPSGSGAVMTVESRSWIIIEGLTFSGANMPSTSRTNAVITGNNNATDHIRYLSNHIINWGIGSGFAGKTLGTNIEYITNTVTNITCLDQPGELCDGAEAHGIYASNTESLYDGNIIDTVLEGNGFQIYSSGGNPMANNVIKNNWVTGVGNSCYLIGASNEDALVMNNICRNSHQGIRVSGDTNRIYNNTVYNTDAQGISTTGDASLGSTAAALVKNNIFYLVTQGGISMPSGNLTSNPSFVNAAADDFTLSLGSAAIDTGTTFAVVPVDILGASRPQGSAYDMGAYERVSGGDVTAPTVPSNVNATAVSTSQVDLTWTASTDAVGVTAYTVYWCSGAACTPTTPIALGNVTTYAHTGRTASTLYRYQVTALDAVPNESMKSTPIVQALTDDVTAPTAPGSPAAYAVGSGQIDVSWTAATDASGVTSYVVYWCAGTTCTPTTAIPVGNIFAYSHVGLLPTAWYRYHMTAKDAAGNEGAPTAPVVQALTAASSLGGVLWFQ